jgi:hypothetical protein
MLIYKNKEKLHKDLEALIPEMLGAEVRALIQNWRKANKLSIDQRIPTLKFYWTNPIFKTVFIEGLSGVGENKHFLDLCLVDRAEFEKPTEDILDLCKDDDILFWSPLGGTIGHGKILSGNTPNIQKELDAVLTGKYYNEYI